MLCQGYQGLVQPQGHPGQELQATHGGTQCDDITLHLILLFQMNNLGHDLTHVLKHLPEETQESETTEEQC